MSVNSYIAEYKPLYIFPRSPVEAFEFLANEKNIFTSVPEDLDYIRVKTLDHLIGFNNSETSEIPQIPFYHTDIEPEKFKEHDLYIYANEQKYLTICCLKKKEKGYFFHSKTNNNDNLFYDDLYLRLSVEANDTGKDVVLKHGKTGENFKEVEGDILFKNENGRSNTDGYYRFIIMLIINNEEETDNNQPIEKRFQIVAKTVRKKGNEEIQLDEKRLAMTYSTYHGWTLTKEGELIQGKTGWFIDENNYYILRDGRRLSRANVVNELNKDSDSLVIGDKDVKKGLEDILEGVKKDNIYNTTKLEGRNDIVIEKFPSYIIKETSIKCKYNVYEELFINHYTEITNLVSMQAFQISVCYNNANPLSLGDKVKFYSIGRDETDIPIVVTQVGVYSPTKKKIVIAGPHGDERNAQFAILETQKNFIVNRFASNDLILFFIPAISPTMFFADARGLPFVSTINYNANIMNEQIKEIVETATNAAQMGLKIEDLHERIVDKRTPIQEQTDSLKPTHGIDTNRDVYNLLKSTRFFYNFVVSEASGNRTDNTTTVFMAHGYESASNRRGIQDRITTTDTYGTLCGPYELDGNNGYIEEPMMDQMDIITALIYGYRYARGDNKANKVDYSKRYFFGANPYNIASSFNGEWARKFYLREGVTDPRIPVIQCYDIELGQDYNEGIRGWNPIYVPAKVTDRRSSATPFFNHDSGRNTKFVVTNRGVLFKDDREGTDPLPVPISFSEFLLKYYDYRGKIIDKIV